MGTYKMDIIVREVTPVVLVGQKNYRKRLLRGTELGAKYSVDREFEVFGTEDCNAVEPLNDGDVIRVEFSVRGRVHNGRVFTNLSYMGHVNGSVEVPQAEGENGDAVVMMPDGEAEEPPF